MKPRFYLVHLPADHPCAGEPASPAVPGRHQARSCPGPAFVIGLLTGPLEGGAGRHGHRPAAGRRVPPASSGFTGFTRGLVGLVAGLLGRRMLDIASPSIVHFPGRLSALRKAFSSLFLHPDVLRGRPLLQHALHPHDPPGALYRAARVSSCCSPSRTGTSSSHAEAARSFRRSCRCTSRTAPSISRKDFPLLAAFIILFTVVLFVRLWYLQAVKGRVLPGTGGEQPHQAGEAQAAAGHYLRPQRQADRRERRLPSIFRSCPKTRRTLTPRSTSCRSHLKIKPGGHPCGAG